MTKPANPKQIFGDTKVPLQLLPTIALVEWAGAQAEGARKYGAFDWHQNKVEYMTYVGAMQRHIIDAVHRETRDKDSQIHPLGHVMACCGILLDAEATGQLIDNRPKRDNGALRRMEDFRFMQAQRLNSSPT